jgi:hypothetical protein
MYAGDQARAHVLLTDVVRRADTLTDPRALLWAATAADVAEGLGPV